MNNDQAKDFFMQGVALYKVRDYGPALEKFETALGLVESSDTQLREDILKVIESVKLCEQDKAEADYYNSQADYYEMNTDSSDDEY